MNYNKYLNSQEFVDNNAKRIPVCIVVDCSGSMKEYDNTSESRINRVNNGINLFYDGIRKNPKTKKAVDVLIIQVGNNASIISDFSNTENNPPKLKYLVEKNNLTEGVCLALERLDERKKIYKSANIDYYQPWLLIMSDGGLNREFSKEKFKLVQKEVRDRENEGKLSVFPVYVQGKPVWDAYEEKYVPIKLETYNNRLKLMTDFSNNSERLINIDLTDGKSFEDLFQFLHKSASSVANNKGIINDIKYGNFQHSYGNFKSSQTLNNNIELYEYDEIQKVDSTEEIPDLDQTKKFENLSEQLQFERERIELARRELTANSNKVIEECVNKPIKHSFEMLVNGVKVYPVKKNVEGKIILTFHLRVNDIVSIIKDNTSKIFEQIFDSKGEYEFAINNSNDVTVTKCEIRSGLSDKYQRIQNINKDIEDTINNILDWDKI